MLRLSRVSARLPFSYLVQYVCENQKCDTGQWEEYKEHKPYNSYYEYPDRIQVVHGVRIRLLK
jgi:hypothetical protein